MRGFTLNILNIIYNKEKIEIEKNNKEKFEKDKYNNNIINYSYMSFKYSYNYGRRVRFNSYSKTRNK